MWSVDCCHSGADPYHAYIYLPCFLCSRALQSQVEDLDIYCCHGIVWDSTLSGYVTDPQSCQTVIKLGRVIHVMFAG